LRSENLARHSSGILSSVRSPVLKSRRRKWLVHLGSVRENADRMRRY
jgi:hypothetical protein